VGSATSQEVLWNFSRFKDNRRVSLKHNPHFYKDLPRSPEAYGTRFQADSIHDFEDVDKVYVLTDTTRRVYLETPQKTRSFGNFWVLNGTILFKGVCPTFRLLFVLLFSRPLRLRRTARR
jgi:hypothetical protein